MTTQTITPKQLRAELDQTIKASGLSARQWAMKHNTTPQAISAFLNKTATAGYAIPEALGYKPVTRYVKEGS